VPAFLVRVLGGPRGKPAFRGTAALLTPDVALTCKHVIEGTDPFGRPDGEPLPEVVVETASGLRVPVRSVEVDLRRDLALLMLNSPVEIDAPAVLVGLSRAMEGRLRARPLFLFGYAESDPDAALWIHAVNDRIRFCSYRGTNEILTQLQLSGGVPAGCSGGVIALQRPDGGWFYAGTVYLGGEASATSRAIMADSVVDFLTSCGVDRVRRADASDALAGTSVGAAFEGTVQGTLPPNPYRGLAAFRETDAGLLFGRDRERERLVAVVGREQVITVVGASGIGKSSLVFAGLVPRLREMGGWTVVACRPKSDPCGELAAALAPLMSAGVNHEGREAICRDLARRLGAGRDATPEIVRGLEERLASDQRLLLIFDQMEEVFAAGISTVVRLNFLAALTAIAETSGRVTLLMVLRADFLARALEDRPWAAALEAGCQLIVPPIDRKDLGAVIAEPARLRGIRLEAGLVERITREMDDAPGALPLLQFTLARMWERQHSGLLTHEAYDAVGGVDGGVVRYAEDMIKQMGVEDRRLRRILLRLVRSGAGSVDSRQTASLDQFREEDWPLIQRLVDARLLVAARDATGADTVELVHEALLRHWPRLQTWLQQEARFRLWHARLPQAVDHWRRHDDDPHALLRGARLAEAEDWLREYEDMLSVSERRYIAASQEQLRRELATEQLRQRRLLGSLALGLMLVSGIAGWATIERETAQEARRVAEQARRTALAAQGEAERQGAVALSRRLAAESQLSLVVPPTDVTRAGLLAVESLKRSPTVEGRMAWDAVMRLLPPRPVRLPHGDEVTDVVFSPTGDRVATGSWDGTVGLWDGLSGEKILEMRHGARVRALAFSPDGRRLASIAVGAVYLWNVATGEELFRSRQSGEFFDLAFAAGGGQIVTAGSDGRAHLWDAASGDLVRTLDHGEPIRAVAVAPDGRSLVTIGADQTAKLWDAATGVLQRSLPHRAPIRAVAFRSDGNAIVTAGAGDVVEARDLTATSVVTRLAHPGEVWSVAFSPDGTVIVSAGDDGSARLWNARSGQQIVELGHEFWIASAVFSPDGEHVATASGDRTARVWDARTGAEWLRLSHGGVVRAVEFSPDGQRLVTRSSENAAWLWRVAPFGEPAEIVLDRPVGDAVFAPDGRSIAVSALDGTVIVRRIDDGALIALAGDDQVVTALSFDASGRLLATAGADGTARVWDTGTGRERCRMPHEGSLRSIAFSAAGTHLATVDQSGRVRLWEVDDSPRIALEIETSGVWSLALDSQATRLATLDMQGSISLYDGSSGRRIMRLSIGDSSWGLDFSADGEHLLAVHDGSVLVWRAVNGRELNALDHDREVRVSSAGADGGLLATADAGGVVRVWNIETGREMSRLPHESPAAQLTIDASARLLAVALNDRTVRLWDIDASTELARFGVGAAVTGLAFTREGAQLSAVSIDSPSAVPAANRPPRGTAGSIVWLLPAPTGMPGPETKVEIRSWPYGIEALVAEACNRLARDLDPKEREIYHLGGADRPTCPGPANRW
jgi:WD40 repeat protein